MINLTDSGHVLVHLDGLDLGYRKTVFVAAVRGIVDSDQEPVVAEKDVYLEGGTLRR